MILVKDINKKYRVGNEEIYVLKNISFKIDAGEFIAIVGASGSGKSTLMNILGCLDVPDSGKYYLDKINVLKTSEDKLAEIRNSKIGFVFQDFNLMARYTAIENVKLPLLYRGLNKTEIHEKAMRAIELVGLRDRVNHKPKEMSGGQQQRTAIARAIAGEPEIILADEPTGNLDSKTGTEIMDILTKLNNLGKTVVLITHDFSVARYAHRILRMRDGILHEEKRE